MNNQKSVKFIVEEKSGIERIEEPVTFGIPLPRGFLKNKKKLFLFDINNSDSLIPLQTEVLAKWPDQSIKWVLLDFMVDCSSDSTVNYYLNLKGSFSRQNQYDNKIRIEDNNSFMTIDTNKAVFTIDKDTFLPFKGVKVSGEELVDSQDSFIVLKDEAQEGFIPVIEDIDIETMGFLRSTIKIDGKFKSKDGKIFSDFFARLSFYAGKSLVRIDVTIKNPKAAKHQGGLWDLGDKGSIYFDDLSLNIGLSTNPSLRGEGKGEGKYLSSIFWKTRIGQEEKRLNGKRIEIYQDSSGGKNWNSPNHVNRYRKVMTSFRGYRVKSDTVLEKGYRATPTIAITSGNKGITATIKDFWQNFPKSIEAGDNILTLRLFPEQYNDTFELQGGEQKTHTIYLQFESDVDKPVNLDWVHKPLVPRATPEWYAEGIALGYMAPKNKDKNIDYQKLVDNVIEGDKSFLGHREKIDEYGWRSFGDVFADHEAIGYKGSLFPFISHYNNQYDVIYGCILQFARSGDLRWYQLLTDLAKHVIDIDIYHTNNDRPVYNGGSFWHTDHFMHAETSTHRSFSKKNAEMNGMRSYGGGPSPENCYTTGLCIYYFLTGNIMAKEAVIELAEWITNMDKIEKSLLGILRKAKRIISSLLNEYSRAPGRGKANAINTLLDAFELIDNRKYLLKAESIIKRFISPYDDIDKLNKQQMELRWFYLIFLQSVGKYLDIKDSMDERDLMFNYAKDSLMHHAKWMLKNEVPYKQLFHVVEIPSSTWSAQDIRKSVIFDYAYKYSDEPFKQAFKEKSEYFYNTSITDVLSFNDESKTFVRPLTILINYGIMHTYFQDLKDESPAKTPK